MLHHMNHYAVMERLESFKKLGRKTAQLKKGGYRDLREPRIDRHWANR